MRTGIICLLLAAGLTGCGLQPETPDMIYYASSVDAPAPAEAADPAPEWSGFTCTLIAHSPQEARTAGLAQTSQATPTAAAVPNACQMLRWFGNRVLDWTRG